MLPLPHSSQIIDRLQKRSERFNKRLSSHKSARQFFNRSYLLAADLRNKSRQLLAGAGLTGAILMTPVNLAASAAPPAVHQPHTDESLNDQMSRSLADITPHTPTKLTEDQAQKIETTIQNLTGITVKATLDNQTLNHQVGFMGYEQHLRRYPGDTELDHDEEQIAGMAPGLGAWGYFARSRAEFTTTDYLREKYYVVAQTLYLPNWNQDFRHLRDWYQYRKVLVVNPKNGTAVVGDIADAGPAEWTGKQFGGSPEVMKNLDLHLGPRKGLVLFLFIDDPNNLIPLGPLKQKFIINQT